MPSGSAPPFLTRLLPLLLDKPPRFPRGLAPTADTCRHSLPVTTASPHSPASEPEDSWMPDIFQTRARTFWFAARFLPADRRQAVAGLYAFARAVDDLVDERPPTLTAGDVSETLGAWRRWLDRTYPLDGARLSPGGRRGAGACAATACRRPICRCCWMA